MSFLYSTLFPSRMVNITHVADLPAELKKPDHDKALQKKSGKKITEGNPIMSYWVLLSSFCHLIGNGVWYRTNWKFSHPLTLNCEILKIVQLLIIFYSGVKYLTCELTKTKAIYKKSHFLWFSVCFNFWLLRGSYFRGLSGS